MSYTNSNLIKKNPHMRINLLHIIIKAKAFHRSQFCFLLLTVTKGYFFKYSVQFYRKKNCKKSCQANTVTKTSFVVYKKNSQ